jgi:hypothetical protein
VDDVQEGWLDRQSHDDEAEATLNRRMKLSPSMPLSQFDNGYWYATQLKDFGDAIGIPSANKLRKDELEKAIRFFLKTGKAANPARRNLSATGIKDVERGLSLELEVVRFTNDGETKAFLEREAQKFVPGLKRKSGVRYRFNRWREEQLAKGVKLTYRNLVEEYVRLNQNTQPFGQIPIDCYINFLSDFHAAEKGATREQAMKAWRKLKSLDVPKNYRAWKQVQSSKSK